MRKNVGERKERVNRALRKKKKKKKIGRKEGRKTNHWLTRALQIQRGSIWEG
jgi:hypothetical protein